MKNNKPWNTIFVIMVLLSLIGLGACSQDVPQATIDETESPLLTETLTSEITDIPTVETSIISPDVILTSSPESDQDVVIKIRSTLETLTRESGLSFELIENLTPEWMAQDTRVVVGVGPNLDLAGWASQFPGTQFIAVNQPGTVPGNNLSVIGDPMLDQTQAAFMAGYLAALISTDYKVAALIPADIENSEGLIDSFVVGARFFCGICQPKYPPYNRFPQWQTLPLENASSGFQSTVDLLAASGTEIIYVQEALLSPELLEYLSELGIKVVSDGTPDKIRNNWVGTLQIDLAAGLSNIWSDVAAGNGGYKIPSSITLTDMDSGLVSEGRYQMFNEMVADLNAGIISIEPSP
jgi:hypothetical protein